jgi:hypothetical protein
MSLINPFIASTIIPLLADASGKKLLLDITGYAHILLAFAGYFCDHIILTPFFISAANAMISAWAVIFYGYYKEICPTSNWLFRMPSITANFCYNIAGIGIALLFSQIECIRDATLMLTVMPLIAGITTYWVLVDTPQDLYRKGEIGKMLESLKEIARQNKSEYKTCDLMAGAGFCCTEIFSLLEKEGSDVILVKGKGAGKQKPILKKIRNMDFETVKIIKFLVFKMPMLFFGNFFLAGNYLFVSYAMILGADSMGIKSIAATVSIMALFSSIGPMIAGVINRKSPFPTRYT